MTISSQIHDLQQCQNTGRGTSSSIVFCLAFPDFLLPQRGAAGKAVPRILPNRFDEIASSLCSKTLRWKMLNEVCEAGNSKPNLS
jgi:hypothetical protein